MSAWPLLEILRVILSTYSHLMNNIQETHQYLTHRLNITTANSTSSSSVIQWSSYNGNGTLLAYRVLVKNLGPRVNRKKREISQLEGNFIRNFTVGPNITAVEIGNLSTFFKYCFQILVITKEYGDGRLSDCFYFYTEKDTTVATPLNETAPKISASIRKSLTTIQVKWDPKTITGVKLGTHYRISVGVRTR
ncbi:hypothetical protein OS493_021914 [Desmophyllum pertusum]|uniref:Fibronectin type-III domain-containing protein n=1 Tax=Desmophyllum pertusum TaxID=174260 RepID=A0A9X0CYX1_9CNID|nr:hypothetical protein OS493_021914 [Desmophyllum pertusum]